MNPIINVIFYGLYMFWLPIGIFIVWLVFKLFEKMNQSRHNKVNKKKASLVPLKRKFKAQRSIR